MANLTTASHCSNIVISTVILLVKWTISFPEDNNREYDGLYDGGNEGEYEYIEDNPPLAESPGSSVAVSSGYAFLFGFTCGFGTALSLPFLPRYDGEEVWLMGSYTCCCVCSSGAFTAVAGLRTQQALNVVSGCGIGLVCGIGTKALCRRLDRHIGHVIQNFPPPVLTSSLRNRRTDLYGGTEAGGDINTNDDAQIIRGAQQVRFAVPQNDYSIKV